MSRRSSAAGNQIVLDLVPWTQADIPEPSSPEFAVLLDSLFDLGSRLVDSMSDWKKQSVKHNGVTQTVQLPSGDLRKSFGISEYWCGRMSSHTIESVYGSSTDANPTEYGVGAGGLYERFKKGLMENHSLNEQQYIEPFVQAECLQVYQPGVAEVWRLWYHTPPPTQPRTFVVFLLSRELRSEPRGSRAFMNMSLPFEHPDCPPKVGDEVTQVRGKYVSVERVNEKGDGEGEGVEWRMCTSSDAGGNIPRFMTNSSLISSISEDVPSFIKWMSSKFPLNEVIQ